MSRIIRSAFLLVLSALACNFAHAQNPRQLQQAMQSLSPDAQQVVTRLGTFGMLPAAAWKYHTGDIPHGEDLDLNDSAWQTTAGPRTEVPEDAVWLRRAITVPTTGYDLTGARIWFQFSVGGNPPEIVYFNGRRVALGEDLEPIILFDNAKPGDKVLVAVKVLHTAKPKALNGARLRIDFSPSRPSPDDLRSEFLSAALLLPTMSHNVVADTATLQSAILAIDLKALDAGNSAAFDASLNAARTKLESLRPVLQADTLHLTGNSHIDAAWLWPWTETVDVVHRTFGTALQLMHEYPDYHYTQSAAAYNDWMLQKYPAINDEIKQRIKEGRWEVVGGMWVEPDLNMPDGEATARSILIGKRFFQQQYGVDVRIGWNPDSFGYNWQLPQIYKKSGIDYFVTQKMTWSDTNQLPFKLFWWQSPDGSKVLTYFPQGYANNNLSPFRLSTDLAQAHQRAPGLTSMMDLYGIGDHGGGPTRAMLDEGVHWSEPGKVVPKIENGTAQSFFTYSEQHLAPSSTTWNYDSIAKGYTYPAAVAGDISIPTWNDEMYLEFHRGVFTTQAMHKYNMRTSEEEAINAEKYASLAWLSGDAYPGKELTDDWKKITFNDFHDLAAGSGINVIYKDAQKDYDDVRWSTNEISHTALKTISAGIDTRVPVNSASILVFNPLAWMRSGLVTVDVQLPVNSTADTLTVLEGPNNKVVPFTLLSKDEKTHSYKILLRADNVPSMGYKVLHATAVLEKLSGSDLKASGLTMENANLRVTVDPATGCITSLFDKKSSFETIAKGGCGNQLQTFIDKPKQYDAWNIDPGALDHNTPIDKADSVKLVENNELRAVIRINRTWQASKFQQDIVLTAGSDYVDVVNDVDWREQHVLLKAAFPLAATSDKATYEIPYGTIQRPTTRNNSWEKARFEVPALRWADLGDSQHGFSLINAAKYGYDGEGNTLRLSLLRSPTDPDPVADQGPQHFTYALYPHAGSWQQALTERHGYEYNYPLQGMQVESHTGALPAEHSFLSVAPENVILTAVKKAEDSNALIFHVYEWAGKQADLTFTVPPGATSATETNLMEKPQGPALPVTANKVTVPIHPFEILALQVNYNPATK